MLSRLTIKALSDNEVYSAKFDSDESPEEALKAFSKALGVCGWKSFVSNGDTDNQRTLTVFIKKEE